MVARSLARVASTVAEELDCKLIVAFTESGSTARLRLLLPPARPDRRHHLQRDTYRRLALWWGVVPVKSEFAATTDEMIVQRRGAPEARGPGRRAATRS